MKDVAAAAGVGLGTVSRVFAGNGKVSAATRDRVLAVARQLRYRPSALGRDLKLQRTSTIGFVVADITNHFYSQLADGVLSVARSHGRNVIVLATNDDPEIERECVDVLLRARVDAIVAVPTGKEIEAWREALDGGVNVVFVDSAIDGVNAPAVLADNAGGSAAATAYLLALGHRRIGFLGGPKVLTTGREREEGFRRAHAAIDVPVKEELLVHGQFTRNTAYATALRLLEADPAATAFLASNNVLGEAALTAIKDRGLRVPKDISMVMFDDVPWASLVAAPVTVVAQPARQMGQQGAYLAINPARDPRLVTTLDTELVLRASCRPVPIRAG